MMFIDRRPSCPFVTVDAEAGDVNDARYLSGDEGMKDILGTDDVGLVEHLPACAVAGGESGVRDHDVTTLEGALQRFEVGEVCFDELNPVTAQPISTRWRPDDTANSSASSGEVESDVRSEKSCSSRKSNR